MNQLSVLAVLSLLLYGGACGPAEPVEQAPRISGPPVQVEVATLLRSDIPARIPVVGTIQARRSVVISARVMGTIRVIHVEEGDRVREDQRLVDLDDREVSSALESLKAAASGAEKAIAAAGYAVESARARLELAEVNYQRFQGLLEKESVTRQEYDQALARVRESRSALAAAGAEQERAVSGKARAEAEISSAGVRLGYTEIRSPIAGIVTRRLQDPGSLAVPGNPILNIDEAGGYQLHLSVPESLVGSLRVGQELPVELDALPGGGTLSGRIVEMVPEVDARTRTAVVKVALTGEETVHSGQYGRAFVTGSSRPVLLVPARAVSEIGQLASVLVVEGGVARRRLVTLGAEGDGGYEVLSGLAEGEKVVVTPAGLVDGAHVVAVDSRSPEPEETGSSR